MHRNWWLWLLINFTSGIFKAEVEFEFTTRSSVQATAGTAMGGGHHRRSTFSFFYLLTYVNECKWVDLGRLSWLFLWDKKATARRCSGDGLNSSSGGEPKLYLKWKRTTLSWSVIWIYRSRKQPSVHTIDEYLQTFEITRYPMIFWSRTVVLRYKCLMYLRIQDFSEGLSDRIDYFYFLWNPCEKMQ